MHPAFKLATWIWVWPLLVAVAFLRARDAPVPAWCASLFAAARPGGPITVGPGSVKGRTA